MAHRDDILAEAHRLKSLGLQPIALVEDGKKPVFKGWQDMHRKYGTKVHFNIYYETEDFNLSQMPDKYHDEWQRNRDWIRLTFHARSNKPDRPYIRASGEQIRYDYRAVTREIERFAGRELLSPVTTVHWGETTREGARALRDEGIRIMPGYFRIQDGRPSVSYYLSRPEVLYLAGLFHDIAKGRGGDHSRLGGKDAWRFSRGHGLSAEDARLVKWLVEEHLTMSLTAQKQDIGDPAVITAFAAKVGSERRLAALYLLTVADIRGTSPRVWNAWKAKLLEDLFLATQRLLAGDEPGIGLSPGGQKFHTLP